VTRSCEDDNEPSGPLFKAWNFLASYEIRLFQKNYVSCSQMYLLNGKMSSSKFAVNDLNETIHAIQLSMHSPSTPRPVCTGNRSSPAVSTDSTQAQQPLIATNCRRPSEVTRHAVSVRVFSEYSTIPLQLPERMAYQQDARHPRLPAVSLHNDGLQTIPSHNINLIIKSLPLNNQYF
jgi:hypothetical protein